MDEDDGLRGLGAVRQQDGVAARIEIDFGGDLAFDTPHRFRVIGGGIRVRGVESEVVSRRHQEASNSLKGTYLYDTLFFHSMFLFILLLDNLPVRHRGVDNVFAWVAAYGLASTK